MRTMQAHWWKKFMKDNDYRHANLYTSRLADDDLPYPSHFKPAGDKNYKRELHLALERNPEEVNGNEILK